jgi:cytochrome c biogenesis protein CcmG/thiol:disulfide interchange protein DsbE
MARLGGDDRSAAVAAPTFYDLLQVAPDASFDEIAEAYRRQQELYDPAYATVMGGEFIAVAAERRAALDEAYGVLRDPGRRAVYDRQIGVVVDETADRRGISRREVSYALSGILAGLLILAAVWYAMGSKPSSGPAVTEVSFPAPPIKARTLDGGHFDLAAHRGKVVLVNFWGTWCEPCKEETPALQAAYSKLADEGLVIVGVDLFDGERSQGRGEQDVRHFTGQYDVQYPIALDDSGNIASSYKLYPIPVSYFIDPQGNVRYIRIGQLRTSDVEQLFHSLQQEQHST